MTENRTRSILKSVSFRLIATLATVVLVFVFTSEILVSVQVGFIEFFAKILLYYFHERLWNNSRFGMEQPTICDTAQQQSISCRCQHYTENLEIIKDS